MQPLRFRTNPFFQERFPPELLPLAPDDVGAVHQALGGYEETPLFPFPALARELGVGELWIKDESKRFGLNAFKALGASYAIHRFLKKVTPAGLDAMRKTVRVGRRTFTTATDGNHGRAVAWTARTLGHKAVIFVPRNTVPARIEAIRAEGAEVVVVGGNYDVAVKTCAERAAQEEWDVISDTAWSGYTEVPGWIMEGYSTLFEEALGQLARKLPDTVFLQAGVGGLAGGGVLFFRRRAGRPPRLISVEPLDADCLLESISSPEGRIRESKGKQDSIMAGLNCGTPSLLAWPLIRAGIDAFVAVDDEWARKAMRKLAAGGMGDPKLVSGESGAAGLAGMMALLEKPPVPRDQLGLGKDARVLLISTEGATDPESWTKIVGHRP